MSLLWIAPAAVGVIGLVVLVVLGAGVRSAARELRAELERVGELRSAIAAVQGAAVDLRRPTPRLPERARR